MLKFQKILLLSAISIAFISAKKKKTDDIVVDEEEDIFDQSYDINLNL